jgi:hypothetical protein
LYGDFGGRVEVVFYDRKNHREVKASQLCQINYVETSLVIDSEEFRGGEWQGQSVHPAYLQERRVASLGYCSESCPPYRNWDLTAVPEDLVFLRFEDDGKPINRNPIQ